MLDITQGWTPERVERLEALFDADYSHAQIAEIINAEYGTHFTRNAVVGKCHRMDLDRGADLQKTFGRIPNVPRQPSLHKSFSHAPKSKAPIVPIPDAEPFEPLGIVGIAALEATHCRYICNTDMSAPVYCGHRMLEGVHLSFCAHHFRLCTGPSSASERAAA